MKQETIQLGAYKNKEKGDIGTLYMIISIFFVGNVPYHSVNYKIRKDVTNKELLIHVKDERLYDTLNNEWEKC